MSALVIEYVDSAEPIGSEQLVHKYGFGVKSATVRNELAELADLGYLEQPHTSAGRIPSDQGYRYYVDKLIVEQKLTESTKGTVRDVASDGDVLQEVLRDTARVLSRVTQLLSVASTVRDGGITVRNAVVSALSPTQALLVLILSNGHVENRMIGCPVGLTLEDVGRANEALTQHLVGKTLRSLSRVRFAPTMASEAVDRFLAVLSTNIKSMGRELTRGLVITEGTEFMFGQPEFQKNLTALNELIRQITDDDFLHDALTPADTPQVVTIGRENRMEPLQQLSIVRHSFFVGEHEAGVIALVGPTRMQYSFSMPLISFTAKALSDSLTKFFG